MHPRVRYTALMRFPAPVCLTRLAPASTTTMPTAIVSVADAAAVEEAEACAAMIATLLPITSTHGPQITVTALPVPCSLADAPIESMLAITNANTGSTEAEDGACELEKGFSMTIDANALFSTHSAGVSFLPDDDEALNEAADADRRDLDNAVSRDGSTPVCARAWIVTIDAAVLLPHMGSCVQQDATDYDRATAALATTKSAEDAVCSLFATACRGLLLTGASTTSGAAFAVDTLRTSYALTATAPIDVAITVAQHETGTARVSSTAQPPSLICTESPVLFCTVTNLNSSHLALTELQRLYKSGQPAIYAEALKFVAPNLIRTLTPRIALMGLDNGPLQLAAVGFALSVSVPALRTNTTHCAAHTVIEPARVSVSILPSQGPTLAPPFGGHLVVRVAPVTITIPSALRFTSTTTTTGSVRSSIVPLLPLLATACAEVEAAAKIATTTTSAQRRFTTPALVTSAHTEETPRIEASSTLAGGLADWASGASLPWESTLRVTPTSTADETKFNLSFDLTTAPRDGSSDLALPVPTIPLMLSVAPCAETAAVAHIFTGDTDSEPILPHSTHPAGSRGAATALALAAAAPDQLQRLAQQLRRSVDRASQWLVGPVGPAGALTITPSTAVSTALLTVLPRHICSATTAGDAASVGATVSVSVTPLRVLRNVTPLTVKLTVDDGGEAATTTCNSMHWLGGSLARTQTALLVTPERQKKTGFAPHVALSLSEGTGTVYRTVLPAAIVTALYPTLLAPKSKHRHHASHVPSSIARAEVSMFTSAPMGVYDSIDARGDFESSDVDNEHGGDQGNDYRSDYSSGCDDAHDDYSDTESVMSLFDPTLLSPARTPASSKPGTPAISRSQSRVLRDGALTPAASGGTPTTPAPSLSRANSRSTSRSLSRTQSRTKCAAAPTAAETTTTSKPESSVQVANGEELPLGVLVRTVVWATATGGFTGAPPQLTTASDSNGATVMPLVLTVTAELCEPPRIPDCEDCALEAARASMSSATNSSASVLSPGGRTWWQWAAHPFGSAPTAAVPSPVSELATPSLSTSPTGVSNDSTSLSERRLVRRLVLTVTPAISAVAPLALSAITSQSLGSVRRPLRLWTRTVTRVTVLDAAAVTRSALFSPTVSGMGAPGVVASAGMTLSLSQDPAEAAVCARTTVPGLPRLLSPLAQLNAMTGKHAAEALTVSLPCFTQLARAGGAASLLVHLGVGTQFALERVRSDEHVSTDTAAKPPTELCWTDPSPSDLALFALITPHHTTVALSPPHSDIALPGQTQSDAAALCSGMTVGAIAHLLLSLPDAADALTPTVAATLQTNARQRGASTALAGLAALGVVSPVAGVALMPDSALVSANLHPVTGVSALQRKGDVDRLRVLTQVNVSVAHLLASIPIFDSSAAEKNAGLRWCNALFLLHDLTPRINTSVTAGPSCGAVSANGGRQRPSVATATTLPSFPTVESDVGATLWSPAPRAAAALPQLFVATVLPAPALGARTAPGPTATMVPASKRTGTAATVGSTVAARVTAAANADALSNTTLQVSEKSDTKRRTRGNCVSTVIDIDDDSGLLAQALFSSSGKGVVNAHSSSTAAASAAAAVGRVVNSVVLVNATPLELRVTPLPFLPFAATAPGAAAKGQKLPRRGAGGFDKQSLDAAAAAAASRGRARSSSLLSSMGFSGGAAGVAGQPALVSAAVAFPTHAPHSLPAHAAVELALDPVWLGQPGSIAVLDSGSARQKIEVDANANSQDRVQEAVSLSVSCRRPLTRPATWGPWSAPSHPVQISTDLSNQGKGQPIVVKFAHHRTQHNHQPYSNADSTSSHSDVSSQSHADDRLSTSGEGASGATQTLVLTVTVSDNGTTYAIIKLPDTPAPKSLMTQGVPRPLHLIRAQGSIDISVAALTATLLSQADSTHSAKPLATISLTGLTHRSVLLPLTLFHTSTAARALVSAVLPLSIPSAFAPQLENELALLPPACLGSAATGCVPTQAMFTVTSLASLTAAAVSDTNGSVEPLVELGLVSTRVGVDATDNALSSGPALCMLTVGSRALTLANDTAPPGAQHWRLDFPPSSASSVDLTAASLLAFDSSTQDEDMTTLPSNAKAAPGTSALPVARATQPLIRVNVRDAEATVTALAPAITALVLSGTETVSRVAAMATAMPALAETLLTPTDAASPSTLLPLALLRAPAITARLSLKLRGRRNAGTAASATTAVNATPMLAAAAAATANATIPSLSLATLASAVRETGLLTPAGTSNSSDRNVAETEGSTLDVAATAAVAVAAMRRAVPLDLQCDRLDVTTTALHLRAVPLGTVAAPPSAAATAAGRATASTAAVPASSASASTSTTIVNTSTVVGGDSQQTCGAVRVDSRTVGELLVAHYVADAVENLPRLAGVVLKGIFDSLWRRFF